MKYESRQSNEWPVDPTSLIDRFHQISQNQKDEKLTDQDGEMLVDILQNVEEMHFDQRNTAKLITALAWRDAAWSAFSDDLKKDLIYAISRNVSTFNPQAIAITLWALASLGLSWSALETDLQDSFIEAIKRNAKKLNPQNIANILWALATFGLSWKTLGFDLRKALIKAIRRNLNDFNNQNLSNTLWAFAALGISWNTLERAHLADPLLTAVGRHISEYEIKETLQILWAQLSFKFPLPQAVQAQLDTTARKRPAPKSSRFHEDVALQFEKLTSEPLTNECRIAGCLDVDICFERIKLIIEVDGPHHDSPRFLTRHRLKDQLLAEAGYTVIRLSSSDNISDRVQAIIKEFDLPPPKIWKKNNPFAIWKALRTENTSQGANSRTPQRTS